jgi:hypothetical protein
MRALFLEGDEKIGLGICDNFWKNRDNKCVCLFFKNG